MGADDFARSQFSGLLSRQHSLFKCPFQLIIELFLKLCLLLATENSFNFTSSY